MKTLLFAVLGLTVCACAASASVVATVRVSTPVKDNPIRTLTTRELNSYLSRMFSNPIKSAGRGETADIVVGTPESNPTIARVIRKDIVKLPEGKNPDQGYSVKTVNGTTYVAARTDVGALYGVYALLEAHGAYFQIDGEVLPERASFKVKPLDMKQSPVFKYRGLMPWDNFLCGISGYNLEDYQQLIDRATRMKLNMLQFHFYGGMAFFTETIGGKTVDPAFIGIPIDVFRTKNAIGEAAFKGEPIFGAKPYVDHMGQPRAQATAIQDMMRKVLDHAQSRGWVACVGFELMRSPAGNPTYTDKPGDEGFGHNHMNPLDPHNVDLSVERYRSLTQTYPQSDFYWMWQSEARGILASNVGREPGAAEFREKYAHWAQKSPIWGNRHLGGDIDYAYLFREVAGRLSPQERSRLATGGWSIEHLFPNIDSEFPKEIIFASLNCFDVKQSTGHQYKSYDAAKNGRRAWMIDWWEFDGEQWFPQFRANWQEKLYRSCVEQGVESVTLLGWKLSGVGHNVRYLAEFSWNPELTAKQFYAGHAARVYGAGAGRIARVYEDYDKLTPSLPSLGPPGFAPVNMYLAPGWEPLAVPALPRTRKALDAPDWETNIVANCSGYLPRLVEMRANDQQNIDKIAALLPAMTPHGKSAARLMMNRLEVRRLYAKTLLRLYEGLVQYDRIARVRGCDEASKAVNPTVAESATYARMAVEKYAEEIRNRGDQGVVAQMNEQFYQVINRFHRTLVRKIYGVVDWTGLRINPAIKFDFSGTPPWLYRDGKVDIEAGNAEGRPILRLKIGGDGTEFHSAHIHPGAINLDDAPYMDFSLRTASQESLAIMFQLESGSRVWHALNLIGSQTRFSALDSLPEDAINNGQWHRVTWDLRTLVREGLGRSDSTIHNIVIGSWDNPKEPIEVEFRDFTLGQRNRLD